MRVREECVQLDRRGWGRQTGFGGVGVGGGYHVVLQQTLDSLENQQGTAVDIGSLAELV